MYVVGIYFVFFGFRPNKKLQADQVLPKRIEEKTSMKINRYVFCIFGIGYRVIFSSCFNNFYVSFYP